MLIEIGNGNVCPFAGIGNSHRTADAAVGTGNQRDLAIEPAAAGVRLLATIGVGLHLALSAWHVLRL
ncbi:hypothetical protein D3C81_2199580 [compost metagenome]